MPRKTRFNNKNSSYWLACEVMIAAYYTVLLNPSFFFICHPFFWYNVLQIPVITGVPLPMRSYFHSATKKVLDHLRAWWRQNKVRFTSAQIMVQHLVTDQISAFLCHPEPSLATHTLFQVEYKTRAQSWLGLPDSHLMKSRCFILFDLP